MEWKSNVTLSEPCPLQWHHNEHDGVSITGVSIVCTSVCLGAGQRKKSKLRVTGLCEGNSPVTGEFPAQKASNAENVFIWWRHHEILNGAVFFMASFVRDSELVIASQTNTMPSDTLVPSEISRYIAAFRGPLQYKDITRMTSPHGNIFWVTGHLCGEFTGDRWITRTKASDADLWCFLWSAPK